MNPWVAVLIAVAVGICVLRAILWVWDTYEVGKAIDDSDTGTQ